MDKVSAPACKSSKPEDSCHCWWSYGLAPLMFYISDDNMILQ